MATDQDPGEPVPRPPLPTGLVPGRRTPDFTADTVPPALLRDHRTTVWARLEVAAGTVEFVDDGGQPVTATPARAVVIVPDRPHRVTPSADAVFAVQFFVEGDRTAGWSGGPAELGPQPAQCPVGDQGQ